MEHLQSLIRKVKEGGEPLSKEELALEMQNAFLMLQKQISKDKEVLEEVSPQKRAYLQEGKRGLAPITEVFEPNSSAQKQKAASLLYTKHQSKRSQKHVPPNQSKSDVQSFKATSSKSAVAGRATPLAS